MKMTNTLCALSIFAIFALRFSPTGFFPLSSMAFQDMVIRLRLASLAAISDHLHNGHNGNKNEYKANDSSTPPQPFILWIYSRVSSFRYAQHSLRIQHSP